MTVENTTNIGGLDATQPPGTALKSEGDDHLRLIKDVLRHSFAGFTGEVLLAATEAQGATVNDYALTLSPAPAAYAANTIVVFRSTHANTGAATLRVGALSIVPLLNPEGTALRPNAITASTVCVAIYDGANFRLLVGNSQTIYDYANQLAFAAALPAQSGVTDAFLKSDGTLAQWIEQQDDSLEATQGLRGLLRLATTTESSAFVNDRAALTPATLKAAFAGNFGAGWQRLPNGFIIQGGVNSSNGDSSFLFPITFPNQLIIGVACSYGDPGGNAVVVGVDNFGPTGMSIRRRLVSNGGAVGGANFPAAWLAIGI